MAVAYPSGDELLEVLVRAERRLPDRREVFKVHPDTHPAAQVRHNGLRDPDVPDSQPRLRCNKQDLVDLADNGLIKIDERRTTFAVPGQKTTSSSWWDVHVTPKGFDRFDRIAMRDDPRRLVRAGTLDWSQDVLPVLLAACDASYDTSPDLGATRSEIAERLGDMDETRVARILFHLVDAGYLVDTAADLKGMGDDGLPDAVRPAEKALVQTAGWPSGSADNIATQLIAALDERIEGAEGEERSRLERLRDGITGIGRDVLVAVLTDAAKRAGGEIV